VSADRVELLVADIEASPDALAATLDAYGAEDGPLTGLAALAKRPIRRVAFSGLGSSRHAALTMAAHLRSRGIAAWVEYPSAGSGSVPAGDLLFVAISASGGTTEVVEAAGRHRGRSRVIAVTNASGSALADVADLALPLFAGDEGSGIATKTYRATLAVLGLLADGLVAATADNDAGGPSIADLRPTIDAVRADIASRDEWLLDAVARLDGAPAIDVLADAADLGLAEQAALMLREGPRLPATAHETADWLHTAIYLALPAHRVLLFSGSEADEAVIRTVAGRGGETVIIGAPVEGAAQVIPVPAVGDATGRAIVGSVVAELLAAELWRRTGATDA
jgi:glutamine---fructose-6-phosphate transaminase (isomerizing)